MQAEISKCGTKVKNPQSNKFVAIGGAVYKTLVRNGVILPIEGEDEQTLQTKTPQKPIIDPKRHIRGAKYTKAEAPVEKPKYLHISDSDGESSKSEEDDERPETLEEIASRLQIEPEYEDLEIDEIVKILKRIL